MRTLLTWRVLASSEHAGRAHFHASAAPCALKDLIAGMLDPEGQDEREKQQPQRPQGFAARLAQKGQQLMQQRPHARAQGRAVGVLPLPIPPTATTVCNL